MEPSGLFLIRPGITLRSSHCRERQSLNDILSCASVFTSMFNARSDYNAK